VFIVVEGVSFRRRWTGLEDSLRRIRAVADYQFGRGVGEKLFPEGVKIVFSRRTGRIRYVYLEDKRLATMRPTDGMLSLSIRGARRIAEDMASARCFVKVKDDVSKFIAEGGDVFAAHVVEADDEVRAKDEVIVLDSRCKVLAVGRAVLSGWEMKAFRRGVAVKVRRGNTDEG
jgi:uncharacterized protein with predicted RNA binding PUA domain